MTYERYGKLLLYGRFVPKYSGYVPFKISPASRISFDTFSLQSVNIYLSPEFFATFQIILVGW